MPNGGDVANGSKLNLSRAVGDWWGRGPNLVGRGSRKTETLSQGYWSSPDEGTSLDPRRADLSDEASMLLNESVRRDSVVGAAVQR